MTEVCEDAMFENLKCKTQNVKLNSKNEQRIINNNLLLLKYSIFFRINQLLFV